MSITNETATALYSTLTGGTALTALLAGTTSVYRTQAPDDAAMPYVIFNLQSGLTETITNTDADNNVWFVRAYSAAGPLNAGAVFEQAHTLLHRQSISVGSRNVFWCARETTLENVEVLPDKTKVWMCGGFYRIRSSGE